MMEEDDAGQKLCNVRAALAKLISQHYYIPAVLQESTRVTSQEVVLVEVQREAEKHGVGAAEVGHGLVLRQIRSLASQLQQKEDSWNCKSEIEGVISLIKTLVANGVVERGSLGLSLLREPHLLAIPLTAVWALAHVGVISLHQIIERLHKNNESDCASLVSELAELVLFSRRHENSPRVVSDFLAALVCLAYDTSKDQTHNTSNHFKDPDEVLRKFSSNTLRSLTEKILDHILENETIIREDFKDTQCIADEKKRSKQRRNENSPDIVQNEVVKALKKGTNEKMSKGKVCEHKIHENETEEGHEVLSIYMLLMENLSVGREVLERFFSAQLVQMLTHRPDIQLAQVLKQQQLWRSTHANTTLVHLMRKLVVVLGCRTSLETLEGVVGTEEVNWGCVLTLIATVLTSHHSSVPVLKEMIDRNIRQGCQEQEMEKLVVGLIFARHASQEGPHLFPNYSHWFSALFSAEVNSPVVGKQAFVFLMKFLTDLVPHEPASCLRAHLTNPIFTPRGCQEILQSYSHLARARLQELRDVLDTNEFKSSSANQAVCEEVEVAVKQFGETSKIPGQVLEASVFREAHFRRAFLPTLLTPRPLPATPDARSRLIDALHSRGKVTTGMLQQYNLACQQEATELMAGVFDDLKEDIILEPITELDHMLKDLVGEECRYGHEEGDRSEPKVLQLFSQLALKIEEMIKTLDARLAGATFLTLDVRSYNEKLLPYQMMVKILDTIALGCHISETGNETSHKKAWWIGQLLALFSGSATLQCALYIHLLHSLQHPPDSLEATHSETLLHGLVLSELYQVEGIFLPVCEASKPNQEPQPFTSFYLNNLSLITGPVQNFACCVMSNWLSWQLSSEGCKTSSCTSLAGIHPCLPNLYLCLAPRLPLVYSQGGTGKEVIGVGDVYRFLQGRGVPKCSALYFTALFNHGTMKVPLYVWLEFELEAGWEDTPINVRQAYLRRRALQDLTLAADHDAPDTVAQNQGTQNTTMPGDVVVDMVFALLKIGLKKANCNDLLLLLQTIGQQSFGNLNPCLLKEWHRRLVAKSVTTSQLRLFMSVCQVLPPAYFLSGERLVELSPLLSNLVELLLEQSNEVVMDVDDAMFLCQCVVTAAAHPDVKNSQVLQCLQPLRPAIVFHWESLSGFFEGLSDIATRHQCLNSLMETLNHKTQITITSLKPEEAGLRLLSMCIQQPVEEEKRHAIAKVAKGVDYLKCLLAYLGTQQAKGSVPFFLPINLTQDTIETHTKIILESKEQLKKLVVADKSIIFSRDILPQSKDSNLAARMVPIACTSVLHHNLKVLGNNQESDLVIINQFDLLLQCQTHLTQVFDCNSDQGSVTGINKPLRRLSSTHSGLPDLDYLTKLSQEIMLFISTLSPTALKLLPKATLLKCESELRSAVYRRLQSRLKN